jgi:hypothetical protein
VTRLRTAALAVVVALLAVALGGAMGAPASADAEGDFVARINDERAGRGIGTLTVDAELTSIARRWSGKMAANQQLAHNPNLAKEVTQDWEKLAENVGYGGDVGSIHDAFMNSSAHRANILDPALTHVGVGVVVDGSGQLWVTEVFMRLRGGGGGGGGTATTAAPAPAPAPTTTARPKPPPTTAAPRPAPAPTAAPPVTEAPPTTEAAPAPEPAPTTTTVPPALAAPSTRLVLVLDRLVALDEGR